MNRIHFVFIPLILLIATAGLAACIPAASEPTAETMLTITPSPTAIPTSTPTAAPTASPTPTFTPTPTPVTLPVTNGTPIPDLPYEVITAENVQRLREIARYGYPRLLDKNPYRLTADGKTIVVGTTLGLEFYDARTQTKTGGFEVEFLRDLDLTPDGQYLLTLAGEGVLTVWTRDGEKVQAFDLPIGDAWALKSVAISPDGKLLAVQRKKADWQETDKVDVYRVADGSLLDTVRGMGAVFSPDGRYLATLFDGLRLYPVAELGEGWEKRLPKQSLPWCGVMEGSCGLVFSPDGTLAAVVRAGQVDVYRVEDRKLVRQVSGWEADQYALPQVQFGVDGGQMVITTPALYDGQGNVRVKAQAILVDIASGEWVSKNEVEEGFPYLDGEQVRTFTWKAEGEIGEFLDIQDDGTLVLRPNDCDAVSQSHCYSAQKVSGNKWAMLKDGETLFEVTVPEGYTIGKDPNDVLVFKHIAVVQWTKSPGGSFFAVFDLEEKRKIFSQQGYVVSSATTADGDLVSIGYLNGTSTLYVVLMRGAQFQSLLKYPEFNYHTMDADGEKLYLFDVMTIKAVNLKTRQTSEVKTDFVINGYISATVSSRLLAVSSFFPSFEQVVGFLNPEDLHVVFAFRIPVRRITFSRDERLFVTQGMDGFIRVWGVVAEGANVR
ncbi:MAG: WD40 repeat domain-containing protein [Anaerolineae bacterium]